MDGQRPPITQTALFGLRVADCMDARPPALDRTTSCADAMRAFAARPESSLLVVDERGRPCGILTARDVVRRLVFQAAPGLPLEAVMTSPVNCARTDDPLFQAIGRMRRHGYRHLPVTDPDGVLRGMLYLDRALASPLRPSLALIERLTHEGGIDSLGDVRAAQVDLARYMLSERVHAVEVQALLAYATRDLYRRVIERVQLDLADDGWGTPPVESDFLVMGSIGRQESFLSPDQDNGMILADYPDAQHDAVDHYFRAYSERVNLALARIGLPLCDGDIMARNPVWRKSASQWRQQLAGWLRRRDTIGVRCVEILADSRAVQGRGELTAALRRGLGETLPRQHAFLLACHRLQQAYPAALGRLGRLRLRHLPASLSGELDLKHLALLPLVGAVRLLCLRAGIDQPSTDRRLWALGEARILEPDECRRLLGARGHFTRLVLEQQLRESEPLRETEGRIPLRHLNRREKRRLGRDLASVERLRQRVHNEMTGEIF